MNSPPFFLLIAPELFVPLADNLVWYAKHFQETEKKVHNNIFPRISLNANPPAAADSPRSNSSNRIVRITERAHEVIIENGSEMPKLPQSPAEVTDVLTH